MKSISISVSLAILTSMAAGIVELRGAVKYVEPDNTTELFALENIPLPLHSMQELAEALLVIAQRKHDASPAHQQATGRVLLLAMQLDPQNKRSHEISKALASGKDLPAPADQLLQKSLAEVDACQRLLSKPGAGEQANILALQIMDVLTAVRPGAANRKDAGDWKGTLPALSGYQAIIQQTPKPPAPKKEVKPTPPKKPEQPKPSAPRYHLARQSMLVPVIIQDAGEDLDQLLSEESKDVEQEQPVSTSLATMTLKLNPCKPEDLNVRFMSFAHTDAGLSGLDTLLKQYVTGKHSALPPSRGLIHLQDGGYSVKGQLALAAPLALLLEASLTNTPLREDVCVLTLVDQNGKLTEPENFWDDLAKLRQVSSGGRLIVAAESLEILQQVLVYQEPDFFTRWEVFTASALDEALAAAAQESSPDILKASELFTSIQNVALENDVAPLVADHDVRERLSEIVELAPGHLSAAMLLLQGGGKRPMHLNERALAHELRPIIRGLCNALAKQAEETDIKALEKTHDKARENLDKLLPLIEPGTNEFFEDTLELANDFRKLASVQERIQKRPNDQSAREKARELFVEMQADGKVLTDLSAKLRKRVVTDQESKRD